MLRRPQRPSLAAPRCPRGYPSLEESSLSPFRRTAAIVLAMRPDVKHIDARQVRAPTRRLHLTRLLGGDHMWRSLRRFVAVLLATGLIVGLTAPVALAAYPGENGAIAFERHEPIEDLPEVTLTHLHLLESETDPESTMIQQGYEYDPVFSPGGTMIAFGSASCEGTDGDIVLLNADGTFLRDLTTEAMSECDLEEDWAPTWSPDGARLAFTRNRIIHTINVSGGSPTVLPGSYLAASLAWSPDRTRIAFTSPAGDLYLVHLDRSGPGRLVRLTNDGGQPYDDAPDWAPDGSALVWQRGGDIYRLSPVEPGSELTPLIATVASEGSPAYSPDGTRLLYTSNASGSADNYVTTSDADIRFVTRLTPAAALESSPDWQPIPEFPLVDARFSSFESAIRWIYDSGIASGCSLERYCPNSQVTRGQMAVFLDRALDLPPASDDYFDDDEGRTFEGAINRVREAGIAFGCTASAYCPDAPVSRGQMAAFLDRALDLPATDEDFFTDDDGRTFEGAVNRVRAAGIAFGCTTNTYCPDLAVRRGQMAAFLYRALAP